MNQVENITAILLGVAVIVLFGVYCYLLVRKHKKPIGELLAWQAVKENESIFVLGMIFACVAESISAATVYAPVEGIIHSNIFSKILQHLFIGFIGIIGSLTFFKEIGSIFEKGIGAYSVAIRVVIVFVLGVMAIGSPIMNLILMAGNLKQETDMNLWFYSFVASHEEQVRLYVLYGKDATWSPWAALQPSIKTSIGVSFFHTIIALLEGLNNLRSKERRSLFFTAPKDKEKDKEKEKDKDTTEENDESTKEIRSNIEFLLKRLNYKDSGLANVTKAALKVLTGITEPAKEAELTIDVAKLVTECGVVDRKTYANDDVKKNAKKKLDEQIITLFGKKAPEGFGMKVTKK